ncbi:MAG TPA: hypothetical protein PLM71_00485 [Syntrophorhabdaceae bacterium]|nr:hypothetical protein [Syntrophorhabdaceae bacterium]
MDRATKIFTPKYTRLFGHEPVDKVSLWRKIPDYLNINNILLLLLTAGLMVHGMYSIMIMEKYPVSYGRVYALPGHHLCLWQGIKIITTW